MTWQREGDCAKELALYGVVTFWQRVLRPIARE